MKKIVAAVGLLACLVSTPIVLYSLFIRVYSPAFRSSEFVSDYFDCYLALRDDSGRAFEGFGNETKISITLYSLFLGEVEVILPTSNSSDVTRRNLTITSSTNETIRASINYPQNITSQGLEGGSGVANITLPATLNEGAFLVIRQQLVFNFSSVDQQHLIHLYFRTENRSSVVIQTFFLCPELQLIRIPYGNPLMENYSINQLGLELTVSGETVDFYYPMRLSDSYRQQLNFSTTIDNAIRAVIVTATVATGSLFISAYKYFFAKEPPGNSAKTVFQKSDLDVNQEKRELTIREFVQKVDKEYREDFVDAFRHSPLLGPFLALILIFTLLEALLLSIKDPVIQFGLAIPFIGVLLAFSPEFIRSIQKASVDRNYNRLKESVSEKQHPLLKALVKMKAKNYEIKLELVQNLDETIFTNGRLLDYLYG